jgi:hypothetical protein
MSTERFGLAEHSRLGDIVESLRAEGWVVATEPSSQDLPANLRGLRLDIVAFRNDDILVGEVATRRSVERDRLDEIARRVKLTPNAHFEVFWLGDSSKVSPPAENVLNLIKEARSILPLSPTGAVLMAWAAVEGAVVRYAATSLGLDGWNSPWQLLARLYSDGKISEGEYRRLSRLGRLRNEIAHHAGAASGSPETDDVEYALEIAERFATNRYVSAEQMTTWFVSNYGSSDRGAHTDTAEGEDREPTDYLRSAVDILAAAFPNATQESISEAATEAKRKMVERVAELHPEWGSSRIHAEVRRSRHDITLDLIRYILTSRSQED